MQQSMKLGMKKNALLVFAALSMAVAGASIVATSTAASGHSHEHGAAPATLQLDAGKKWETDGALRQAMGNIRQTMAASLHEIHENKLSKKGYAALAHKVESEVGQIVAELLAGADQMAGKAGPSKKQNGAVQVIGALEKYATYFDDAGLKPIAH